MTKPTGFLNVPHEDWLRWRALGVIRMMALIAAALLLAGGVQAADGGAWATPSGFQDPENKWVSVSTAPEFPAL